MTSCRWTPLHSCRAMDQFTVRATWPVRTGVLSSLILDELEHVDWTYQCPLPSLMHLIDSHVRCERDGHFAVTQTSVVP